MCIRDRYYDFTLTTPFGTCNAADPYARSAGVNGVRSMIFDPVSYTHLACAYLVQLLRLDGGAQTHLVQ